MSVPTYEVEVYDPKVDRVDYIKVYDRVMPGRAKRIAKYTFAMRYAVPIERLRTKIGRQLINA